MRRLLHAGGADARLLALMLLQPVAGGCCQDGDTCCGCIRSLLPWLQRPANYLLHTACAVAAMMSATEAEQVVAEPGTARAYAAEGRTCRPMNM